MISNSIKSFCRWRKHFYLIYTWKLIQLITDYFFSLSLSPSLSLYVVFWKAGCVCMHKIYIIFIWLYVPLLLLNFNAIKHIVSSNKMVSMAYMWHKQFQCVLLEIWVKQICNFPVTLMCLLVYNWFCFVFFCMCFYLDEENIQ